MTDPTDAQVGWQQIADGDGGGLHYSPAIEPGGRGTSPVTSIPSASSGPAQVGEGMGEGLPVQLGLCRHWLAAEDNWEAHRKPHPWDPATCNSWQMERQYVRDLRSQLTAAEERNRNFRASLSMLDGLNGSLRTRLIAAEAERDDYKTRCAEQAYTIRRMMRASHAGEQALRERTSALERAREILGVDYGTSNIPWEWVQVGWIGPVGIIPGGMDNDPVPGWQAVYVRRHAAPPTQEDTVSSTPDREGE